MKNENQSMLTKLALAFLVAPLLAGSSVPISLNGTWQETHSNNYVQTTTQVDWKCVVVHVHVDEDGDMTLQKTASLHGGPINITSSIVRTKLRGSTFATPTNFLPSQVTYDVHAYDNRTLVVTGEEVPAMYIWMRPSDTTDGDDEPVDVPRILAFAQKLGFHSSDRYYNEMVETYNARSC